MKKRCCFLSNHKDLSPIQELLGEDWEVVLVPHPYIEPRWTTEDVEEKCQPIINALVSAENVVLGGDYTLVSCIVLHRNRVGKKTGFLCMERLSKPDAKRNPNGTIQHTSILKPIAIRWV